MPDYPHQRDIIRRVEKLFASRRLRILIQAPTGSGKTRIALRLTERAGSRRVLYLVPSTEILNQTHAGLLREGVKHTVLFGGKSPSLKNVRVLLAMSQTVARRIPQGYFRDWRPEFTIMDEVHKLLRQHWNVADTFKCPLVGLSATPIRHDGQDLSALFPDMIQGPPIRELVRQSRLVPTLCYSAPMPDLTNVKIRAGEFEREKLEQAYLDPEIVQHVITHWKMRAEGRRTIVFCAGVKASTQLAQEFIANGVRAVHVDAKSGKELREKTLLDLAAHKIDVICNCNLFTEGVDVVEIEAVQFAMATASMARFLQGTGRGMRTAKHIGKKNLVVIDHGGNVARHGPPDAMRNWEAMGDYNGSDLVACRFCQALHAAAQSKCPSCGFVSRRVAGVSVGAKMRSEKALSRRTPPRRCPAWALPVSTLWLKSEKERYRHGYRLPSPDCVGYTESRCMRKIKGGRERTKWK